MIQNSAISILKWNFYIQNNYLLKFGDGDGPNQTKIIIIPLKVFHIMELNIRD